MYTVSRQHQWPDGDFVVEISSGGIDYCNPDAYSAKYPGELQEYLDPREAVETAIEIAKAWQKDVGKKKKILIGMGATAGFTMPFDGEPLTKATFKEMRERAIAMYNKLPKCDRCGDILGKDKFTLSDYEDFEFCSSNCAEHQYEDWQAESRKELRRERLEELIAANLDTDEINETLEEEFGD